MNPTHSCFCTRYDRLKHRGVTCPDCGVEVRFGGWRASAYIALTIDEIRERLRSRIHAIFNRVSRWLDSLFGIKRRMTWRQQHFYDIIDTRLPRYEIVHGQWEKVNPES